MDILQANTGQIVSRFSLAFVLNDGAILFFKGHLATLTDPKLSCE